MLHIQSTKNHPTQRFNPDLLQLIPAEQLDAELEGGVYRYEFDHETYWRQLCAHAGVRGDGSRFVPEWKLLQEGGRGKRKDQAEDTIANGELSEVKVTNGNENENGGLRLEEVLSVSASASAVGESHIIHGQDVVAKEEGAHIFTRSCPCSSFPFPSGAPHWCTGKRRA